MLLRAAEMNVGRGKDATMCPKCGTVHSKTQNCTTICCSNCRSENEKSKIPPGGKGYLKTDHCSDNFKECHVARRIRASLRANIFGSF